MKPVSKSLGIAVWGALALTALFVVALFINQDRAEIESDLSTPLPTFGELTEFSLTNQFDQPVFREDLLGKVWIANIIFTRCPLPCLKMSAQISELQNIIPENKNIGFLTLTTDPDFDTPEILKRFGKRFNADFDRWTFLTGDKEQIQQFAVEGLKLTGQENPSELREDPDDLFIHSTTFVLVDQQGRLRGTYGGTDSTDREKLLQDIEKLLKE